MSEILELKKKIKSVSIRTNTNASHLRGLIKEINRGFEKIHNHESRMEHIERKAKCTSDYLKDRQEFEDEMALKYETEFQNLTDRINSIVSANNALSFAYISGAVCFFVYLWIAYV